MHVCDYTNKETTRIDRGFGRKCRVLDTRSQSMGTGEGEGLGP